MFYSLGFFLWFDDHNLVEVIAYKFRCDAVQSMIMMFVVMMNLTILMIIMIELRQHKLSLGQSIDLAV